MTLEDSKHRRPNKIKMSKEQFQQFNALIETMKRQLKPKVFRGKPDRR